MNYKAFKETYKEKMCPFCLKKSCKKLITIKGKNVISIKCKQYQLDRGASK